MLETEISFPFFEFACHGRAGTPRALAEIREYKWTQAQRQIYRDTRHRIDLVLSHRPPAASGRFIDERRPARNIGQMIFLPAGHALESEWQAGEQRSICCVVDPALLGETEGSPPEISPHALDLWNPFVRSAMERLGCEALAPGFASSLMVESLCQAILIDLQRTREPAPSAGFSRAELAKIDDMLMVDGPVPEVSMLSGALGLSCRHFSRMFRTSTGMSVGTYAHELRTRRAQTLLTDERLRIKEIAWKCGFANAAAFSAAFRRRSGMTPSEYRRARRA